MRTLVLSDLHSNLEATISVIEDAARHGFDRVACLGDIVGYGASPAEVIALIRDLDPAAIVRGNHDKAACGITGGETFHDAAFIAAMWTCESISAADREFLAGLPEGPVDAGGFLIAHGSPVDEEEYIIGEADACLALSGAAFDLAFFGHTHFPCRFTLANDRVSAVMMAGDHETVRLEPRARYLVNPGSIGQPRDHNPKASYALFDDVAKTIEIRRVSYDIAGSQARILAAGLPEVLARRLELGV